MENMETSERLVRFDWAIKRLLRNKADYCVVEGFLTVLLGRPIFIKSILESESNQDAEDDKFNRVDLLAEDSDGELLIFEIQNNRELDYFHRMAYGTSKTLCEHIKEGEQYSRIRKVYSINIVYFSLGQGNGYAYHGTTEFVNMIDGSEKLKLSAAQQKAFHCETPADIFPEYYILRVDKFEREALTPLDEWISFLKTSTIPLSATAPGLKEARQKMKYAALTEEERRNYNRMMENLRYQKSVIETGRTEGYDEGYDEGYYEGRAEGEAKGRAEGEAKGRAEGEAKGRAEGKAMAMMQVAEKLKKSGMPAELIADATGLTEGEIIAV